MSTLSARGGTPHEPKAKGLKSWGGRAVRRRRWRSSKSGSTPTPSGWQAWWTGPWSAATRPRSCGCLTGCTRTRRRSMSPRPWIASRPCRARSAERCCADWSRSMGQHWSTVPCGRRGHDRAAQRAADAARADRHARGVLRDRVSWARRVAPDEKAAASRFSARRHEGAATNEGESPQHGDPRLRARANHVRSPHHSAAHGYGSLRGGVRHRTAGAGGSSPLGYDPPGSRRIPRVGSSARNSSPYVGWPGWTGPMR
jgi:hypothetical protein